MAPVCRCSGHDREYRLAEREGMNSLLTARVAQKETRCWWCPYRPTQSPRVGLPRAPSAPKRMLPESEGRDPGGRSRIADRHWAHDLQDIGHRAQKRYRGNVLWITSQSKSLVKPQVGEYKGTSSRYCMETRCGHSVVGAVRVLRMATTIQCINSDPFYSLLDPPLLLRSVVGAVLVLRMATTFQCINSDPEGSPRI
jgi:hypothetical protein